VTSLIGFGPAILKAQVCDLAVTILFLKPEETIFGEEGGAEEQ